MSRNSVVCNDSVWLSSRIDRHHSEFSFVHGALDLDTCEQLKIMPLSQVFYLNLFSNFHSL
jgi:hypothetical protein